METENNKDEISLKELLQLVDEWFAYFKSKWKTILIAGMLGGLLGIGYSVLKKPTYTAVLTYAVEDEKSGGLSGMLGVASSFGLDFGQSSSGGAFAAVNLMELFKSRAMVEKALLVDCTNQLGTPTLAEYFIETKKWRADWEDLYDKKPELKSLSFNANQKRTTFTRVQDSVLSVMFFDISKNILTVEQLDKKVAIGTIQVKFEDEIFAKCFTEALTHTVTDFYIETKSQRAKENLDILNFQIDSVRAELNSAMVGVAVANDQTFGLNPALNVKRVPSAKRQVDTQVNSAVLQELVKQTEMAKVAVRKETPLIQIIDSPIFPLEVERLGILKGLVIGGFLFGFLSIVFLGLKRFLKQIMDA